jgi:hypothetical protein
MYGNSADFTISRASSMELREALRLDYAECGGQASGGPE